VRVFAFVVFPPADDRTRYPFFRRPESKRVRYLLGSDRVSIFFFHRKLNTRRSKNISSGQTTIRSFAREYRFHRRFHTRTLFFRRYRLFGIFENPSYRRSLFPRRLYFNASFAVVVLPCFVVHGFFFSRTFFPQLMISSRPSALFVFIAVSNFVKFLESAACGRVTTVTSTVHLSNLLETGRLFYRAVSLATRVYSIFYPFIANPVLSPRRISSSVLPLHFVGTR